MIITLFTFEKFLVIALHLFAIRLHSMKSSFSGGIARTAVGPVSQGKQEGVGWR